jgi:microcystin-dependent protein
MSQPYIGEIRMFAGNFAPVGWNFCDGSLIDISANSTLYQLIGTTYGGDGQTTFALPDLRSRVPIHMGPGGGATYTLAQNGGVEIVTLTTSQIPLHSHVPLAAAGASGNPDNSPQNNVWSGWTGGQFSNATPSASTAMNAAAIGSAGGSQPHDNMVPFQAINFIISMFGVFPSQT